MTVRSLMPREAFERISQGVRIIDLRGEVEQLSGMAQGATAVPLDTLLTTPAEILGEDVVLLICQKGIRSANAVETLRASGFNVVSVEGGTDAWLAQGLPIEVPNTAADIMGEDAAFLDRYSRQMRLPQVGLEGQIALRKAKIVVVGAGGLGAPVTYYLAAAGVGHITLIDPDVVDRSNLQRQIVHVDADVGALKVDSARSRLLALNPYLSLTTHALALDVTNASTLIEGADVVIDGSDNFAVRHALNAACVEARVPLVYGAVDRFTGQASVFNAGSRGAVPCYRCLFPDAPEGVLNCAEAGVLGVVPGMVGMIQATETLKLLLGLGESLSGVLLQFDALNMQFKRTRIVADPVCPTCAVR